MITNRRHLKSIFFALFYGNDYSFRALEYADADQTYLQLTEVGGYDGPEQENLIGFGFERLLTCGKKY